MHLNKTAQSILAVVALPPPTHGQAAVNQAVVDALSATRAPVAIVNTSPGSLRRGLSYHAKRLRLLTFKVIPSILGVRGGVLYSVVEPGHGMYYNFLVILFSRVKRLRIALHHHSAFYTKAFDRRFELLSRLAGKQTLHIALDEAMARDLKMRYASIERVIISHNASHVTKPDLMERRERTFSVGFMSNLSREKGLDVFLDCVRSARSAGMDVQAVLAGPSASRDAEKMIADAKGEFCDKLNIFGPVSGSSKEAFFRSIDIFLFPTRYKLEAQPLVVIEALSYGVPVVVTEQGYCAELIGETGVSGSIADFQKLATSFVARCYSDAVYLQEMRAEARRRFEILRARADVQMDQLVSAISSAGLGSK